MQVHTHAHTHTHTHTHTHSFSFHRAHLHIWLVAGMHLYGCTKSFKIHLTDWTQKKKMTPFFFQRTFLQQLRTLPCGETICSTTQPRLILICLQKPSWTPDMHLWCSQTGYPSIVSSLLGIERSRWERGLVNTVGVAAGVSRSYWESQLLLPLCACWHCHDEIKATEFRLWGGAVTKLRRSLGGSDACTSLQWLSVCWQEERWRRGPVKQTTIFFCVLPDLLSFQGGDLSWNSQAADCFLVSRSYW